MSTRDRLVVEASGLLDAGGEVAVTLRAVGNAAGVSHNAPYRHFEDRGALLAAVAERDFSHLATTFADVRASAGTPIKRVEVALAAFIQYGRDHPARYRLLFSDPAIGAAKGSLEAAALAAFAAFAQLIEDAQATGQIPTGPVSQLTALVYATTHGLIDLEAGGRMRPEKGLVGVEAGVGLLLRVLGSVPADSDVCGSSSIRPQANGLADL